MAIRPDELGEPSNDEWTDLGDAFEVAVDVNDAKLVVQCGAGNEEIWDRRSVPHSMVVRKVALENPRAIEQVGRCGDDLEGVAQICLEGVVVLCRACRVELLELADRAEEQGSRQLGEQRPKGGCARSRALVEEPAPQRHISSEASTLTSARWLSFSR